MKTLLAIAMWTQEVYRQWITLAPSSGHVVQCQDTLCQGWIDERYLRAVFLSS